MKRKAPRPRLIDDSAFLLSRVKEREPKDLPQFRSRDHLAWIRTLPCILYARSECRGSIEAAHLRIGTDGGGGLKPSDLFCSPQCQYHHKISHIIGERSFWEPLKVDPVEFCLKIATTSVCPATRTVAMAEYIRRYVMPKEIT